jgi:hypothetical protein
MTQPSPDVTITRWRKFGRDRLYVARADGTKLGYWDLVTDEAHPERPELTQVLEAAYLLWSLNRHPRTSVDPSLEAASLA